MDMMVEIGGKHIFCARGRKIIDKNHNHTASCCVFCEILWIFMNKSKYCGRYDGHAQYLKDTIVAIMALVTF